MEAAFEKLLVFGIMGWPPVRYERHSVLKAGL